MNTYTKEVVGEVAEYFEEVPAPPKVKVDLEMLEEDIAREEDEIAMMQERLDTKKAKLAAFKKL